MDNTYSFSANVRAAKFPGTWVRPFWAQSSSCPPQLQAQGHRIPLWLPMVPARVSKPAPTPPPLLSSGSALLPVGTTEAPPTKSNNNNSIFVPRLLLLLRAPVSIFLTLSSEWLFYFAPEPLKQKKKRTNVIDCFCSLRGKRSSSVIFFLNSNVFLHYTT